MSVATDAPASTENLTTEEAITSLLSAEPVEDTEEAPAEEEVEPEPEPEAPEGEGGEGDEEDPPEEDDETPEAKAQPASPPPFWPDEDKAAFAKLPANLQEKVKVFEETRNKATAQALNQAAEARKRSEAEAAQLAQLAPRIAAVADQAQVMFDRPVEGLVNGQGNLLEPVRWADIDWTTWHKTDPFGASAAWTRYESEKRELERVQAANQVTQQTAYRTNYGAYLNEQGQALAALNPTLAADGKLRQSIGQHLIERGYTADELKNIGAKDMDVAYDAMRWRQLEAKTRQAPKPGETPPRKTPAQTKPLRTSSGASPAPSKNRASTEAFAKLVKSGSTDDAVAVLLARGRG